MKRFRPLAAVLLCLAFHASASTSTGTADAIVGTAARATATDPLLHRAFVADRHAGNVAVYDLVSGAAVGTFAAGPAPVAVLANAANSRIYVVNDGAPGSLSVVNAVTGDVVATIALGDHPTALAADFARAEAYVVNNADRSLAIVDLDAGRVRATLAVGDSPNGVALDRVRGTLYVSNALDGTLSVIDAAQATVLDTVGVGRNPGVPAVDERTGRVFVAALDDGVVTVYDPGRGAVTALAAGGGATSGTWSPAYRKYFVPNANDGSVTVVDADALRSDTIDAAGPSPRAIAVDEDAGNVYVDSQVPGSLTLLDARDGRVRDVVGTPVQRPKSAAPPGSRLVLRADDDGIAPRLAFLVATPLRDGTAIAAEYYDADLDVYFHTSDATEKRLVDDGVYGSVMRATASFWRVWTASAQDRVAVCRFVDFTAWPRTAHVYAVGAACDALHGDPALAFERDVYYVALPNPGGNCPADTEALYRLRKDVAGTVVVRITPEQSVRDALTARGWTADGEHGTGVFACTPALGASRFPSADEAPHGAPRFVPIIPPRERPR